MQRRIYRDGQLLMVFDTWQAVSKGTGVWAGGPMQVFDRRTGTARTASELSANKRTSPRHASRRYVTHEPD